ASSSNSTFPMYPLYSIMVSLLPRQEPPHRADGSLVGFLLRVGPVKHGPHTVQGDSDPRSFALGDLRVSRFQHSLDVPPGNVGPDGILEDRLQRVSVLLVHPSPIVSLTDTTVKARDRSGSRLLGRGSSCHHASSGSWLRGKSLQPFRCLGLAFAVGSHFGISCGEAVGPGNLRVCMGCGRFCGHGHSSWLSFDEGNAMRSALMSSGGLPGAFRPESEGAERGMERRPVEGRTDQ